MPLAHCWEEARPYTARYSSFILGRVKHGVLTTYSYNSSSDVDLQIQTYTEPIPLEYGKLATDKISVAIQIFLQCRESLTDRVFGRAGALLNTVDNRCRTARLINGKLQTCIVKIRHRTLHTNT